MNRQKGLGRGLDALLGGSSALIAQVATDRLTDIPVDHLRPGRYQPRTRMDPASLAVLADSIRARGVMQPILVRPVHPDRYEIIAGERRWRAARMAGLDTVPASVREVADDAALVMALIENIQRDELNAIEEAQGIQRLIDEFGLTHEAAADAVGRSRVAVSNLLRLLNLAKPVQEMLLAGTIEMGHGRALLGVPPAAQDRVARQVVEKQLSVRETERLVRALDDKPRPRTAASLDPDIARLVEELSESLGASVMIKHRTQGHGRVSIDYASLDQLEAILARLRETAGGHR